MDKDTLQLSEQAIKILDKKKAIDIVAFEVTELTIIADCFIIASGTSSTHVRSLADDVEDALSKEGIEPRGIEGKTSGWILLDYGSVVIHIFTPDQREFYNLERLWQDAKHIDVAAIVGEE